MNAYRWLAALTLALSGFQFAMAAALDSDPFFYDPGFNANGISVDGVAGPSDGCYEDVCQGVKMARLSNGDTVTAVNMYSYESDGVGGSRQSDGDFALIRHNSAGQRLAWPAPTAAYNRYNDYIVWPYTDVSGRMVTRTVDIKAVGGYIYVLFEYWDGTGSNSLRGRTGLTVFSEAGHWVGTKFRVLCQIDECNDSAVGLAVVAEYGEPVRLIAVGAAYLSGAGVVKTRGMLIGSNGYVSDDPDFGDSLSRNSFPIPATLCVAAVRPCQFTVNAVSTAVDHPAYDATDLYLVGDVKYDNSANASGQDNDVLVIKVNRLGNPESGFGTGGFRRISFDADGTLNDKGIAVVGEGESDQGNTYYGSVYVVANVGKHSIGLTKLDGATGNTVSSFGSGGRSIKGGQHCDTTPCYLINFPEDYASALIKDGNRLVVAGTHAFTTPIIGGGQRYTSPSLAVARANDGYFTELASHLVPGGDAWFNDILPVGNSRYVVAGGTQTYLAVTARLRADRIFGDGLEKQ